MRVRVCPCLGVPFGQLNQKRGEVFWKQLEKPDEAQGRTIHCLSVCRQLIGHLSEASFLFLSNEEGPTGPEGF